MNFVHKKETSSRHNLQLYNISLVDLSRAERRVKVIKRSKQKWSDTRSYEVSKTKNNENLGFTFYSEQLPLLFLITLT